MFKPSNFLAATAALFLAALLAVNAARAQTEKSTGAATPTLAAEQTERERKLAEASEAAKRLLLVMDTGKTGKVSREEWMRFMEAEFNRLDTKHNGELDVKELTQSRVRYRPSTGK
jgi:hypothetical protein